MSDKNKSMATLGLGALVLAATIAFVLSNKEDISELLQCPVSFWPGHYWIMGLLVLAGLVVGVGLVGRGARALLVVALALTVFAGCADGLPDQDDARAAITSTFAPVQGGLVELVDLEKIDGVASEEFGVAMYKMECRATFKALHRVRVDPPPADYRAGETIRMPLMIDWQKTERGWKVTGVAKDGFYKNPVFPVRGS